MDLANFFREPVHLSQQSLIFLDLVKIFFILLIVVHFHAEAKQTSVTKAIWVHTYLSSALLHDLLHNWEAETDAFVIQVCSSVQLAKASE